MVNKQSAIRKDRIHPMQRTKATTAGAAAEKDPPSLYVLGAMCSGMLAMWMKIKIAAWASLFFSFAHIATAKKLDILQIMSSLMYAVISLAFLYVAPMYIKNPRARDV